MKLLHFILVPLLSVVSAAKPLPDATVRQAAARIDRLLEDDLKAAGLTPTRTIDDATFLRRAYLGVIGRIPSHGETTRFLDDPSKDKRHDLIDQLVDSPGFDSHLFNWAADLLRLQTNQEQFGVGWHVWLRQSLAENKPWDVMVSEMLSSTGHCSENPAVGYYLRDRNMQLDNFSNSMQVFLGRQIGCAQCHDHPFDDWSQYDYYQMAAFSGGFQYRSQEVVDVTKRVISTMDKSKPAPKGAATRKNSKLSDDPRQARAQKQQVLRERKRQQQANKSKFANVSRQLRPLFRDFNRNAVVDNASAVLTLPDDYQYKDAKPGDAVPAETLFGDKLKDVAPEARRDAFATWVASRENPYFTKVIANRMWQRTFGFGLVDPVDDWKDDSETRHPDVLAYLETSMKGADYDLREFLRILFHTRLFQRECLDEEPTMGVALAFRGPVLTRMSAEQIFDSFLVLRAGKVNDTASSMFQTTWDDYREDITNLVNAPSRDLLILAESAKQGEAARVKAQSEVRDAQKQLAAARNPAQRKAAQAAFTAARTRLSKARSQEMPVGRNIRVRPPKSDVPRRASEYPAPFAPGTMVREFGGSDRETPSSSHTTATVPQALGLLNDPKTDLFANGRKSQLVQELVQLDSAEARLDHLFLTVFAELPTQAERTRYQAMVNDPAELRDLARAMLTSNRFLFIQ